jgi:hypothetical protein
MKCHNVHHVSLLEPTANNLYLGQWPNPPPLVEIDGEDEYLIEAMLDAWIHHCQHQYLVKCIGYNMPEWEPTELHSNIIAVDQFHEKYSDKPRPLPDAT